MKRLLLALALLLAPVAAHAQCANSNMVLFYGGPFTGFSTTLNPGDETFLNYEVDNTNPPGTCPVTYCLSSFQVTIPGRPTPNYMVVLPSPGAPACQQLLGGQNFIAVVHVTTAANDGNSWVSYGQTPPFKYLLTTQVKIGGVTYANDNRNINVLDPWDNTVTH